MIDELNLDFPEINDSQKQWWSLEDAYDIGVTSYYNVTAFCQADTEDEAMEIFRDEIDCLGWNENEEAWAAEAEPEEVDYDYVYPRERRKTEDLTPSERREKAEIEGPMGVIKSGDRERYSELRRFEKDTNRKVCGDSVCEEVKKNTCSKCGKEICECGNSEIVEACGKKKTLKEADEEEVENPRDCLIAALEEIEIPEDGELDPKVVLDVIAGCLDDEAKEYLCSILCPEDEGEGEEVDEALNDNAVLKKFLVSVEYPEEIEDIITAKDESDAELEFYERHPNCWDYMVCLEQREGRGAYVVDIEELDDEVTEALNDNAVKDCKNYKLVAHCEEDKPVCDIEKPVLPDDLTDPERDMTDEEFYSALDKALKEKAKSRR